MIDKGTDSFIPSSECIIRNPSLQTVFFARESDLPPQQSPDVDLSILYFLEQTSGVLLNEPEVSNHSIWGSKSKWSAVVGDLERETRDLETIIHLSKAFELYNKNCRRDGCEFRLKDFSWVNEEFVNCSLSLRPLLRGNLRAWVSGIWRKCEQVFSNRHDWQVPENVKLNLAQRRGHKVAKAAAHVSEHLVVDFLVEFLHAIESHFGSKVSLERDSLDNFGNFDWIELGLFEKMLFMSGEYYSNYLARERQKIGLQEDLERVRLGLDKRYQLGNRVNLEYGGKSKICLLKSI